MDGKGDSKIYMMRPSGAPLLRSRKPWWTRMKILNLFADSQWSNWTANFSRRRVQKLSAGEECKSGQTANSGSVPHRFSLPLNSTLLMIFELPVVSVRKMDSTQSRLADRQSALKEREAGLHPSLLSPSLLNQFSPEHPSVTLPTTAARRSSSKVQLKLQFVSHYPLRSREQRKREMG